MKNNPVELKTCKQCERETYAVYEDMCRNCHEEIWAQVMHEEIQYHD